MLQNVSYQTHVGLNDFSVGLVPVQQKLNGCHTDGIKCHRDLKKKKKKKKKKSTVKIKIKVVSYNM